MYCETAIGFCGILIELFEMSAAQEQGKSECRDFARGVCNRGNKCKFYHPQRNEAVKVEADKLPICKDFQNKGCDRMKCKFLHISQREEEQYNITGVLPEHGGRPENVHALGVTGGGGVVPGPPSDVCKDFLNNICQRGSRCKFRHVTEEQYLSEMGGAGGMMYGKRRRDDFGGGNMMAMNEENEMLRRKITDLQRQVMDLRQMNDTLYEQNTRYRNQLRSTQTATLDPYNTAAAATAYPPTSATVAPVQNAAMLGYDVYTKF